MASFRSVETAEPDESVAYAARVKAKYRIDKLLEGKWVPMALLAVDSKPEKRDELCRALGGKIRVMDVQSGVAGPEEDYE